MRRAITLIVVLTVMCLGLGLWLDLTQRHTAREYLDALDVVRTEVLENRMDSAAHEQAYLHARWQYDAGWLNFLIGHHHTRAVTSAMLISAPNCLACWAMISINPCPEPAAKPG